MTSILVITIEVANELVRDPPTLHPRPNKTNIRALVQYFEQKLGSVPSHQSRKFSYLGMVTQPAVYALKCNKAWTELQDPGPHRTIDPLLNTDGQNN